MTKWIEIAKRKPPQEDCSVLVAYGDGTIRIHVCARGYLYGVPGYDVQKARPTHWRPLPPPPRTGENKVN